MGCVVFQWVGRENGMEGLIRSAYTCNARTTNPFYHIHPPTKRQWRRSEAKTRLGGEEDAVVVRDVVAGGAEAVAVERGADVPPVREGDLGCVCVVVVVRGLGGWV